MITINVIMIGSIGTTITGTPLKIALITAIGKSGIMPTSTGIVPTHVSVRHIGTGGMNILIGMETETETETDTNYRKPREFWRR
jgi:hypothetical protein